jgi:hypothetical protein
MMNVPVCLFRKWMRDAQRDLHQGGEIKPVKQIWRRVQPDRTRRLRKDYGVLMPLRKVS